MNTRKTARVLLCLNLLSLPWAISSQAVTITWTNLSGGNWSAAANWSPNQVPASSDSALITANGTYTVTLDISPSVSSLTLGAATGQQSLSTAGQNLTLVQAGAVGTNGIIELNGGGLFGSLTVSGQLNWTSGQLGGGSTGLAVATNGVLTLAGLLGTDYVLGEFLTNAGTINLQSGNLEIDYCGSDYGQLINLPGALVYLQSDVSIDVGCLGQLNNQGTVLKSAGTGTSGLNCIFNNTGALNVASGAILMAGGGNLNGNGAVANGAQLNFGGGNFGGNGLDVSEAVGGQINVFGGTVSLAPSSPLPSLVLTNGTLTLNGTVTNLLLGGGTLTGNTTIAGTLTWTNGMLGNANTALTVSSNALLELAGVNGTDYALGEYLDNYGTVELRSGNLLLYWNDWGAVNNYPGGLLNIAADVSIDNSDNGPGIMNQGTVLKSGGTGVTSINSYFNNTGNLEVASGTVILADGGTLNGGGTVASGARLSFGGGNFGGTAFNLTNATGAAVDFSGATLQAVNLSGDGAFSFNSGTLTLNPSAPLPDLVLTNGTLTLNGTVTNVLLGGGTLLGNTTIAGTMTWTNGVLGNSSAALTVLSNAVLVLAGVDGTDYTLGEYLNNYGTVDLQSGNLLLYWNAWGSVNNFPGALLNIEADVSIDDSDNGPGLVNQGTVLKSAATGVTSINCVFNNTGVLDVASGTVVLNNGGTLNGDGLVASGAQLIFAAGNFGGTVFNLTNAPGALVEVNGANLQAVNVTGSGDFSFNSGSLTLNPSTPLPSLVLTNGNLTLNGTVTNVLLGGGTLLGNTTIAGTMTWTNGVLGNTSAALTVLSNAVLVLAGVDGTDYTLGEYLNNYGTVDLQSGNLLLFWNAWGSVNNFPGALLNIEADVSIDDSDNGPGLVNHGTVLKSGGTGVSSINGAFVNTGTLSVQTGTVDLTAACTLTGGTLQFGFNSLTNFGKINLSGTAGLTGTLIANLNDGYIPPVNTSFTVLTFSSFNGAFTNAYSESGAIWQTNYTANSVFLVDVGQILWAPPADITYGAPLGAGQLDASTSPSLAGSFSYTPVAGTVLNSGPGQTLATLFSPSDPSYIPSSLQVPLTVLQAPLDITATNQSKTYGQNISFAGTEFLAGGLVNGDTVTSATIASAGAISNAPVSGSPYAITITNVLGDAGLTNYIITYTKGALAVNPAPLGITADSLSKTYGSNVVFAGTEFISTPLQNAESIARVMLVSAGAISNAPVSGSPYSITPTALAVGSFSPGNYAITYTPGTLTVNRAVLTVTANPASRTYGAANPAFSAAFSGFVNGETAAVINGAPSFSTPATVTSGVGNYSLAPSLGTLSAANYAFGPFIAGSLMINPAPLTITANSHGKTYGQTVVFAGAEFTPIGLLNGDTVTSATLSSPGAAATATVAGSPYPITVGAAVGNGLGNYAISYDPGALTVTPAPLTITADNRTKIFGQTVTFAGSEFTTSALLNSDTVTHVTLTSAGAAATAGLSGSPYNIVPSAAEGNGIGNYKIGYVDGLLTIMEPSLSFAFSQPNLILAWTTNASAFALLQAPDLDSSTKWTPVTNDITVSGASNTVSIDTSNGNQFYRLSAP